MLVGALPAWDAALERVASLGFNAVLVPPPFAPGGTGNLYQVSDPDLPHPVLEAGGDSVAMLAALAGKAKAAGLDLHIDLVLDRVAAVGALAAAQPRWFGQQDAAGVPDPRLAPPARDTLRARWTSRRPPPRSAPGGRKGCAASPPRGLPASAAMRRRNCPTRSGAG